jgi:sugar phosphate isomerase/epimerase
MTVFQILPSTTSHKHEALLPTLDVFARLGWRDLDLNLNHIIERGVDPDDVRRTLDCNGQRTPIVSGGWCDFFHDGAAADETARSVDRQIALTRRFGADRLRLFFGRLPVADYTEAAGAICARNLQRVADRHPDVVLIVENHDGVSSRPDVCRRLITAVDRANVRLTFDPINFEHRGVRSLDAATIVAPLVAHVHLKGYADGEFCGFGEGDVDLMPALRTIVSAGYTGAFTVEYEGRGDRTIRLYESVARAHTALAAMVASSR